jgi:hypothetical protein
MAPYGVSQWPAIMIMTVIIMFNGALLWYSGDLCAGHALANQHMSFTTVDCLRQV